MMMMNHFQPYNTLLGSIMSSLTTLLFFFFLFLFLVARPAAAAGRENPLVELSSSADLIELAGYGEEKLSTVVVSGTLLCSSCSDGSSHLQPHPVQGGSVAVSCHATGKTRKSNWVRGTTDEYGEFFLDLPSHLHAIPNLEKKCTVKILQLPRNSPCHHAFTGQHKGLKLLSSGNGSRMYTTEGIHLTPKSSRPCIHKRRKGKKMIHSY